MEYYYSVQDAHNFTHSIDNCVVSYYLKCTLNSAVKILHDLGSNRPTYYENLNKTGCSKWSYYRDHIHYDDGIYIKLGKYKIWLKEEKRAELLPVIQIEVNPNKHAGKASFNEILDFICQNCTDGHLDKYDYAIDIPVALNDVQVFGSRKEKGLYKGTRYFGQRNKHGYCKIYDKGKEQKSADALTRVEHTLVNDQIVSLESFYIRHSAESSDLSDLSNSTKTIVLLCLEIKQLGGDYLSIIDGMNPRTKKQILEHSQGGFIEYEYDLNILNKLLAKISDLFYISYTDANGFMNIVDEELPFV